ncbi:N-acetyl-gamma-glutamyl-phosphate reductase [Desulfotalea psychrophila]|uniref:N-acetyl-gamma-glutamyl-phosphate reductase n=1 Tax=Desulfotalea psychrophila (strain LSv54 / DSM 12343) TaxID=177439 RepID=ARGC_DESPS|nr:N-acetyl-gamma-glutamyl-phosphate reductase [Desulfotalea psychrophila]Q6ANM0.1 RecName: Full=N-acetyl-gamma-glutamyl-phosphate reductase; Short=AGPR; AltName: Full=N-acetyl-glutamate semialdehyde dehydrogenase; Short=NAGSA dehydrogenase [Desulfotalea psychrophila LSv54]CAG36054.1 probable N-acetyl-gamma-glutamyl-phosphate reductase [Desulfotalea psychrophila LSv54]
MIKIAIIGASGYTGVELSRLLCNHPQVEITAVTSRQYAGVALSEVFPNLRGRTSLICENLTIEELCLRADLFFAAVPHKTAMNIVPQLLAAGKKVIDLSADFRLNSAAVYEEWYQEHSAKEFLSQAVYGLPELYREQIAKTQLLANPGCYPTSIILGMAPLLRAGIIKPQSIIADSKSGTTGAGRGAKVGSLFCEVNDGFKAYGVGRKHRHTPEIEQELGKLANTDFNITFTPHLLPISRGILSTIYADLNCEIEADEVQALYEEMYKDEPFVRVLPLGSAPATQYVRGSNYCDIGFAIDQTTGRIIVMSAIDNVVKGAAGQAVQNMNIMCGFAEQEGLEIVPLFP